MSEVRIVGECEKFFLMSWKNMNILFNHRWKTLLSIMMPCIFAIILVILRKQLKSEFQAISDFEPIDLNKAWNSMINVMEERHEKFLEENNEIIFSCFIPNLTVAYAPNTDLHTNLMENAASKYLNNINLAAYKNAKELIGAMLKQHYIAGIYFNELPLVELEELNKTTPNMNYSIIFPSELRIVHDIIISKGWETNHRTQLETLWKPEPSADGGYLGYIREGFASIQNAISMSFIEVVLHVENLPVVKPKRFPVREFDYDPLMYRLFFGLPMVILLGYLYPCTNLIEYIVKEKEIHVGDVFRVLGIQKELEYFCWFTNKFPFMLISTMMVTSIIQIRWVNGSGILGNSSWWLIFIFLTSYNVASINFCYMISSATTKTETAVIFLGILWFLSYLPYLALKARVSEDINSPEIWLMFLFSNSSMAIGFHIILDLEKYGKGLQWNNFFDSEFRQHKISVGLIAFLQLCVGVLYMFVGLYMADVVNGISKLYVFTHRLIRPTNHGPANPALKPRESQSINLRKTKIFEIEPGQKKLSIEIKELNKHILGRILIRNVSFCIYEGEITVIMGHNASGKTLLLSLIAGILKPSSGSVIYNETEELQDIYDRVNMGLCIKNILFPELTVTNQIILFCRLKGLNGDALKEEVLKYLKAMDLTKVAHKFTCDLTHGQKRHLSACCALCGNSKYVLLDEPSSGMDLVARKMLWELLLTEKHNRTIIITSHSSDEADIVGDRLVILSGGELMCSGSMHFLKTVYGEGFRLVCVKDKNCDTEIVTKFLRQYIPYIQPESDIGCELSYRLKEYNSKIFSKLLADLENSFFQLQLTSCSISGPTADDIFLRMGSQDPSEHDHSRLYEIMNGCSIYIEEYEKLSFANNYKTYTGVKLFISQWRAMIKKRILYHKNRKKIIVLQFCMPALVTFLTYLMKSSHYDREPLPHIIISKNMYPHTSTIIETLHNEGVDYREEYNRFRDYYYQQSYIMGTTHFHEETGSKTFREFIKEKQETRKRFWTKYILGATYSGTEVIAWFSNSPLHAVPISLNMVHNALIRSKNFASTITVIHAPLPYETNLDPDAIIKIANFGNIFASNLATIISFVFCLCLSHSINERQIRFKLLQYIHGMRTFTFLLSSFVFELIKIVIVAVLVVVIMLCFGHSPQTLQSKAIVFQAIIVFGVCIIPFYYLISHLFTDKATGYSLTTMFNLYGDPRPDTNNIWFLND